MIHQIGSTELRKRGTADGAMETSLTSGQEDVFHTKPVHLIKKVADENSPLRGRAKHSNYPPTMTLSMTETKSTTPKCLKKTVMPGALSEGTTANFFRNTTTTKRSLSESTADDYDRSGAAVNSIGASGGADRKMWKNELVVNANSSNVQPKRRRREGDCGGGMSKRISDAIDVGIRVALVVVFCILETRKSFHRKVQPDEMWLYMNPRTPDIVTPISLILTVILGPFFITLVLLQLTGDRRDFRAANWVWTLALGLNGLATSLLKITVGRHRPDFFYRCFPDGVIVLNNITDSTRNGTLDYYSCTGNAHDINEGRKSFPSGHASFAFVGLGFIAFYVSAKLHTFNGHGRGQTWRLCIFLAPLIAAAMVAVSRTCDYHHHWEDVLVGSVIGLCTMYFVYRQYYPSIFSPHAHRPYLRGHSVRAVYKRIKCDDGGGDSVDENPSEAQESEAYDEDVSARTDERRPLIYDH